MKKAVVLWLIVLMSFTVIRINAVDIQVGEATDIHVKKNERVPLTFLHEEEFDSAALTWENYNNEVALIEQENGIWHVKGLNYGSARLLGYLDGVARVSILVQVFDSMVFLNSSNQIDINETFESSIAFQPATTIENFEPTYSSSDPSIASINETGTITGHKIGKVTITANYLNQSASKEVEVIDRPDFAFTDPKLVINVDSSVNIPFRLSLFGNTDKTIVWRSSNETIATVDQKGIVYGLSQGSATISAFVNGNEYLLIVEVIKSIEKIDLGASQISLNVRDQHQLEVKITPQQYADTPITWSSSRPTVARVAGGNIEALSVGDTVITAKIDEIEQTILVKVNEPLQGLTINPARLTLQQGGRYHMRVSPKPSTSNEPLDLKYSSSDQDIVTVDDYGNVTALSQGRAFVFVQHNEFTASMEVSVNFAEDERGQKKMIGSLNNNQVVTFDLRGVEDVSEFSLEIPSVNTLNQFGQVEVRVALDELSYLGSRLLTNSLHLSKWYENKDVHLTVFDHQNNVLFEYVLNQFDQANLNLFPSVNTIQSPFENFDGHLIEVVNPLNLKNSDRLTVHTQNDIPEDVRLYLQSRDSLRLVNTRDVLVENDRELSLRGLSENIYYLTDEALESRLAPFLLIVVGIVALITSFFMIKRYNEQSIKLEEQERSRNESINYKQQTRQKED